MADDKEINERVDAFKKAIQKLVEEHQIDITAQLDYTINSIVPKFVFVDKKEQKNAS